MTNFQGWLLGAIGFGGLLIWFAVINVRGRAEDLVRAVEWQIKRRG
jgi:hypothetical protein